MIKLKEVTKKFGSFTAVDSIDLEIRRGEILGLLGPNGAGKTTTMRMITGFFPHTSGYIEIDDKNILNNPLEIREKIGYLPESNPLYFDMRVFEYLIYVAKLKKVKNPLERASWVIEKTGLEEMQKRLIGKLSKGYKQRVGIAQALINEPEILILDEPTVGLDPRQIVEIRELIRSFAKEHTVILSTHILPEVSVTCDRAAIMHRGKIIAVDKPQRLLESFKTGYDADVFVEFEGEKSDGEKIISKYSREFECVFSTHNIFKYRITKTEKDIRPELVKDFVSSNINLYEIYGENPQLEHVFISLVGEEENKYYSK
ncbi:MAG: ABC transporter ATP-binding protein [Candidatus Muiribacteriota bacterium]